jgi:hypothetical protein
MTLRKFLCCLFILIACDLKMAYSQNTGIGTTNPTEKLHVNGNINVSGTIKANGVDGTAGQVLMKNSSNALTWGTLCDYKNFVMLEIGSGNWQVPAGVTKILVELWGAGGGGNVHGGGGGGAYAKALYDVVAFQNLSYTVGDGGAGALNANATVGGTTSVTYGGTSVFANGGSGASYNNANYGFAGSGGVATTNVGGFTFMSEHGKGGTPFSVSYHQFNSTTFYQTGHGGNGGDSGNSINTGGIGTFYVGNSGTNGVVSNHFGGLAVVPGGGGHGSYSFGGNTNAGGTGARGKIIIHY